MRNLFVRGQGFSTDPTLPGRKCGLNSVTGRRRRSGGSPSCRARSSRSATPSPRSASRSGTSAARSTAAGTTVFPTKSLADPTQAHARPGDGDLRRGELQRRRPVRPHEQARAAAVELPDARVQHLRQRQHLRHGAGPRRSPSRRTSSIGRTCTRRTSPGTFLPVTARREADARADHHRLRQGLRGRRRRHGPDRRVLRSAACPAATCTGPASSDLDMTAMDVNNDGCVELPFVADPTTLRPCDPSVRLRGQRAAGDLPAGRHGTSPPTSWGTRSGVNVHTSDRHRPHVHVLDQLDARGHPALLAAGPRR